MASNQIPGASYSDAALIVSAVLSALTSEIWPGIGKDKARFAEALVVYLAQFQVDRVSNLFAQMELMMPGPSLAAAAMGSRIVGKVSYGEIKSHLDLDEPCAVILQAIATTPWQKKVIKENTLACLLYKWVRCGYAHEYRAAGFATSFGFVASSVPVYLNELNDRNESERRLFIPIEWIGEVALHLADKMDTEEAAGISVQRPYPAQGWWLDT